MPQIDVFQFCRNKRVEIGLVVAIAILLLILVIGWFS
jgi:hypothetical protein